MPNNFYFRDRWIKVFKNGPSKICGRQPLKIWRSMVFLSKCPKWNLSFYIFSGRVFCKVWKIGNSSWTKWCFLLAACCSINYCYYCPVFHIWGKLKFFAICYGIIHLVRTHNFFKTTISHPLTRTSCAYQD